MINRITMKTVACLRSKCHLKQNLILSWPELDRDHSGIPVAFPISGAKQNTQTKHFVGHSDRHTWQYCRSLWFSAHSVRRISKSLTSIINRNMTEKSEYVRRFLFLLKLKFRNLKLNARRVPRICLKKIFHLSIGILAWKIYFITIMYTWHPLISNPFVLWLGCIII